MVCQTEELMGRKVRKSYIHVATAIEYKAEAFITNDMALTKLQVEEEIMIRGL